MGRRLSLACWCLLVVLCLDIACSVLGQTEPASSAEHKHKEHKKHSSGGKLLLSACGSPLGVQRVRIGYFNVLLQSYGAAGARDAGSWAVRYARTVANTTPSRRLLPQATSASQEGMGCTAVHVQRAITQQTASTASAAAISGRQETARMGCARAQSHAVS